MFEISVSNDLAALNELHVCLDAFAGTTNISDSTKQRLMLIIEELFVNFVYHGAAPDGQFEIQLETCDSAIRVRISDDGVPFNPLASEAVNVDAPLEERGVGGIGVHLIRQLSDELCYQRAEGRNIVELRVPN